MYVRHFLRRDRVLLAALLVRTASRLRRQRPKRRYDVLPDQVYVERDSGPLKADVYVPHGEGPFPGDDRRPRRGVGDAGPKRNWLALPQGLAKQGYTAAAISYRLAPQDKFPAQIYDCQAAVRWLRANAEKYKVDPDADRRLRLLGGRTPGGAVGRAR